MSTATETKVGATKSAFPAQSPGAVAECPYKRAEAAAAQAAAAQQAAAAEVKTSLQMTQQIVKTMGGGAAAAEQKKAKDAWIEIILVDMDGKPMPGVKYRITPPGGAAPVEGRLNEHGQAGVFGIEPGTCKVTFPDLDQDAWE